MKYYLIVGEASGDLHASHLMTALKAEDPQAEFRFFGGDLMAAVGGTLVKHYKELAYMGFIPVLLHLRTIFANMKRCKEDIAAWQPDVLILVDYPGFNLNIAKFVHARTQIPVVFFTFPSQYYALAVSGPGKSTVSGISSGMWTNFSPFFRSRWSSSRASTIIPYIM